MIYFLRAPPDDLGADDGADRGAEDLPLDRPTLEERPAEDGRDEAEPAEDRPEDFGREAEAVGLREGARAEPVDRRGDAGAARGTMIGRDVLAPLRVVGAGRVVVPVDGTERLVGAR